MISFLLIGIVSVSADLLPWFGKITGAATVSAPVFYLDAGTVYTPHELYALLIDQIPSSEKEINFSNSVGERTHIIFETEPLNVDYFYPIELHAYVQMKTNNGGNTIQAQFVKINENGNSESICYTNSVNPNIGTNFTKRELYCNSTGEIDLSSHDRVGLNIWGTGNSTQIYYLRTGRKASGEYSRIEVTAQ